MNASTENTLKVARVLLDEYNGKTSEEFEALNTRRGDMTFEKFLDKLVEYRNSNPSQRHGRAFFNLLCEVRPDLAERLRGSTIDPFYRDDLLPDAVLFVQPRMPGIKDSELAGMLAFEILHVLPTLTGKASFLASRRLRDSERQNGGPVDLDDDLIALAAYRECCEAYGEVPRF